MKHKEKKTFWSPIRKFFLIFWVKMQSSFKKKNRRRSITKEIEQNNRKEICANYVDDDHCPQIPLQTKK